MLTKELIDYIGASTSFVVGTDLFWGIFPNDDRSGVLISDLPGAHNESGMGGYQVLINSRYQDYNTSLTKIKIVYDLFAYSNGFALSTKTVFNSTPVSTPGFLGRDDTGRVLFGTIFKSYTEV